MSHTAVRHRRALHAIPEEADQVPKTAAYVRAALEGLRCCLSSPTPHSVCAFFDAGREETVAFRADMDGLPMTERTGLSFSSRHPGMMHACGHDGHMAMVLALAEELERIPPEDLPRNVLLLFQPAEETPGGARPLCEAGVLQQYNVTRIFGLHLWPKLPAGQVFCRPGPMMARAAEVDVIITGRSVHVSRYGEGADALEAGAAYLRLAYEKVSTLPLEDIRVLRFGKMVSGTVRNAVSAHTVLQGSLRTYEDRVFDRCRALLEKTGEEVASATGCAVSLRLSEGYPAVWNHEGLYETLYAGLGSHAPAYLDTPAMAAEDFSFYQRERPGVFFFLGTGDTPELHADNFDFDDEAVLPRGVAFWKRLVFLP